jgi:hypothetical protein
VVDRCHLVYHLRQATESFLSNQCPTLRATAAGTVLALTLRGWPPPIAKLLQVTRKYCWYFMVKLSLGLTSRRGRGGMSDERRQHRATVAGVLIGIGVGGIVLHQIAQWHNMLSNLVPPHTMEYMRVNMTWDGLFHTLT